MPVIDYGDANMQNGLPVWLYCKAVVIGSPFESIVQSVLRPLRFYKWHRELREIALEEERIGTILDQNLGSHSNCVDVGCHIGSFLSGIIARCPKGTHFAFEPSRAKSSWLKRKFPRVEIYDMAVGEQAGVVRFEENRQHPGFSRLAVTDTVRHAMYYDVKVTRIDDVIPADQRIDLVKLDIEGHELAALKGARATIERNRPLILFECGAEGSLTEIGVSRRELFELLTVTLRYDVYTPVDFLYRKGPLTFDEFRKCGLFPFRAFNFFAVSR